jgi:hypothetical protein
VRAPLEPPHHDSRRQERQEAGAHLDHHEVEQDRNQRQTARQTKQPVLSFVDGNRQHDRRQNQQKGGGVAAVAERGGLVRRHAHAVGIGGDERRDFRRAELGAEGRQTRDQRHHRSRHQADDGEIQIRSGEPDVGQRPIHCRAAGKHDEVGGQHLVGLPVQDRAQRRGGQPECKADHHAVLAAARFAGRRRLPMAK